jgi:hypothetical protein
MVYVVQNYLVFFNSVHRLVCGSFTKDHLNFHIRDDGQSPKKAK